jgi:hypothetical protein
MQQRGCCTVSTPGKGGVARSWSLCKLLVNKSWKGRRAKSRHVISWCLKWVSWQSTKLISWASEQHPKSNDTAKLKNNQQTITTSWQQGDGWWIADLAPKKETDPQ